MNTYSVQELTARHNRCRDLLKTHLPHAKALMTFSRLNNYYFTGTMTNGLFYLPLDEAPCLLCRRGMERARAESPLETILPFKSYKDLQNLIRLPKTIAAEMNGLSWALSEKLVAYLPDTHFVSGDKLIRLTRSVKSHKELAILKQAGIRHNHCLTSHLPEVIHEGMSELDISRQLLQLYFNAGYQGVTRMENFGEEIFTGHIAIGDNANQSSLFNGPVGLRGMHPATPFLGSPERTWNKNELLVVDTGFTYEGYLTDKTRVYFLGEASAIPEKVKNAHQCCVDLQAQIAKSLKPGVLPEDIWQKCLETISGTEWEAGFMGLGQNKVCFAGHGIGLAMDEFPVIAGGVDIPLEENMVLAIEPKIGLPGTGMVGVENSFVVTENGGQSLTGHDDHIILV